MNNKLALIGTTILIAIITITYHNYLTDLQSSSMMDQALQADLDCGFTDDFKKFLNATGNSSFDFERSDIKCGAYGGRSTSKQIIKKTPVIFIHGNSDVGFGRGTTDGYVAWQTGFRSLATFLVGKGYQKSQLYTTTWGPADPNKASNNTHSKQLIMRMRAFVEAVLKYTDSPKVNIIGHSMGVTIGRKIIKGGIEPAGNYDVGSSLKDKVNIFVGIAGANLGLVACWSAQFLPTCNSVNGFYPGATLASAPSVFLSDLNKNGGAEGDKVYAIWSKYDDLIMYQCVVNGKITCRIPGQTGQIQKTSSQWTHFALRDNTGPDIIGWL